MSMPFLSKRKVDAASLSILLIGLAVVFYLETWWPAILLPFGVSSALHQFLRKRYYDAVLTILVFGAIFFVFRYAIGWITIIPIILIVSAIYIFFREFLSPRGETEVEIEEEINEEIAERKRNRKHR